MSTALSEAITALPGAAAALVAWRAQGKLQLTIVVKATFAFALDAAMPRVDPQPILRAEVYHGHNPARSIRLSSDLAPYLRRAEVLFTGHAHAPAPGPASSVSVRLAIFDRARAFVDKILRIEDPAGFERLPLVYERALGGVGVKDNPVGVAAPSIVDPAHPDRPAGFGPIARAWPARRALLGCTSRKALDAELAEIPEGFDGSYFQAAPVDQRADELPGDAWILLEGLHPTPILRMCLPGARGLARLHGLSAFGVAEGRPLDLRLDTVRIDGDEERCTLVWRQSVPLPADAALAEVRVVAGVELPGAPIAWPVPRARRPPTLAGAPSEALWVDRTLALDADDARHLPVIPFQPAGAALALHPALQVELPASPPGSTAPGPISPWAGGAPAFVAPAPDFALAASNAAAGLRAPAAASSHPPAPAAPAEDEDDARDAAEVLDLLWYEPKCLPRARKHPAFQPILDALAEAAPDPDLDAPDLDASPVRGEERRQIFEILVQAPPSDAAALRAALRGAVRADRKFVAPLVLLAGELVLAFDPLARLGALTSALSPLAGDDKALQAALDAAGQASKQDPLPPTAEAIATRLSEAYAQGKRALPLASVETQVEQALLDQRRYLRRTVFGGRHLRGRLLLPGDERPLPVYLPDAIADLLPLLPRFSARLLVEAHLAADPRDQPPVALRVLALARSSPPAHRW